MQTHTGLFCLHRDLYPIWVGNLVHTITEAMLTKLFKKSVKIPLSFFFNFFFLCFDSRVLRTVILCLLQGRGCSQCEAAEQQTLWLRKLCSQRLLRRGHPQLSRKRTPDVIAWLESVLLVPSCYTAGVHTVLLCQIPCLCAIPNYKVVFQTPPLQTHPSLCLSCLIF